MSRVLVCSQINIQSRRSQVIISGSSRAAKNTYNKIDARKSGVCVASGREIETPAATHGPQRLTVCATAARVVGPEQRAKKTGARRDPSLEKVKRAVQPECEKKQQPLCRRTR